MLGSSAFRLGIDDPITTTMPSELRIGVAGTGSFTSRVLIPGLSASGAARVVALYARNPDRVAETARENNIPHQFDTFEAMLELEGLQAVAVCTPNYQHVPMASAAIAAGKAVLSEKPLGVNSTETLAVVRQAAAAGVLTAVNFTYRSMPAFMLAKEMIQAGEIGELISGIVNYGQANWADPMTPLDWRMTSDAAGAGALADLGSHVIDLLFWYGGDVVAVAGADFIASDPRPVDLGPKAAPTASDTAAFVCDIGGGRVFSFHLTKLAWGHANQIYMTLVGTRGSLRLFHERGEEITLEVARPGEFRFTQVEIPSELRVEFAEFPAFHMGRVSRALLGEAEFATFADGHRAQCVIDAIRRSRREGRWIQIEAGI